MMGAGPEECGHVRADEGMFPMSTLDEWMLTVSEELGLDTEGVDVPADIRVILDLARDAARGVARPAAPLTTYLVGIAVGRGMPLQEAAAKIAELARAR